MSIRELRRLAVVSIKYSQMIRNGTIPIRDRKSWWVDYILCNWLHWILSNFIICNGLSYGLVRRTNVEYPTDWYITLIFLALSSFCEIIKHRQNDRWQSFLKDAKCNRYAGQRSRKKTISDRVTIAATKRGKRHEKTGESLL